MSNLKNTETELRFLVKGEGWKALGMPTELWQGYLSSYYKRVVRIRIKGEAGILTIKGEKTHDTNLEMEYPVPKEDALKMLKHPNLIEGTPIHKFRYIIEDHNIKWKELPLVWEVDEFLDENAGLQIAEIELRGPETFEELEELKARVLNHLPTWIGKRLDFSKEPELQRYFGNELAMKPFSQWTAEEKEEMLKHVE